VSKCCPQPSTVRFVCWAVQQQVPERLRLVVFAASGARWAVFACVYCCRGCIHAVRVKSGLEHSASESRYVRTWSKNTASMLSVAGKGTSSLVSVPMPSEPSPVSMLKSSDWLAPMAYRPGNSSPDAKRSSSQVRSPHQARMCARYSLCARARGSTCTSRCGSRPSRLVCAVRGACRCGHVQCTRARAGCTGCALAQRACAIARVRGVCVRQALARRL
jgi:hypothetical protein